MTLIPIVLGAGHVRPQPVSHLSSSFASGRQSCTSRAEASRLLGDETWLRRAYERDGDNAIGAYLGVSANTVRRARLRLEIVSRPRGAQYGARGGTRSSHRPAVQPRQSAAMQIAERIGQESAPDGPPATLSLVAARVRSLHVANEAHDLAAMKDALISLASAAGLVLDHLQTLEAA